MPSTITHAYIGIDTLTKLNKEPKNIINNHINNYKIYCQNMDVLYFYHILYLKNNQVQVLGHRFHNENVFDYFKTLIEDNKKNKNHELFTFIAGLITHYKADSIIHPYINYLSHNVNRTKEIDKHFEIETYLDNYFINKYETNNYQRFNNSKLVFNYTEERIIKEEITKIFKQYFNFNNMGIKYYQALKTMAFVYKHIRYDKYGIKRILYKIIDFNPFNIRKTEYLSYHFRLDNDSFYLNSNHHRWFNYNDERYTSNQSFIDLYNDVIEKSSFIINELYDYIFKDKKVDLYRLIDNYSYSTGLKIA